MLTISGRGTAVTGAVERGTIAVGDPAEIVGLGPTLSTVGRTVAAGTVTDLLG